MKFDSLVYEVDSDGILLLTINRPDKLNALNATVVSELGACFRSVADDDSVRAVIVTGAGDKAFVAGADIGEFEGLSGINAQRFARRGQDVFNRIEDLAKPVVAAVNGFALGGGCELALACHIRIAADSASFGQPEVNLGLIPGYGGTQRLPRLVGRGTATEMILTGKRITAQRAYEIGLVNAVVPTGDLLAESRKMLRTILEKAPVAVDLALRAIAAAGGTRQSGLHYEAALFGQVLGTEDAREGVKAFFEKRAPDFKGR